jgi:molecular chaperone Hsp33
MPGGPAPRGDHLVRGIAFGGAVRVVAAVATTLSKEAARRHHATGPAAVALGRGAVGALLLAPLTKGKERITV